MVPRKSPDLAILQPSGNQTSLSSFKGKVVVIEFLLVNCPHCWRVAQMMAKLQKELGPRGFQPIGVAFDTNISGAVVAKFVKYFNLSYPVGSVSSTEVDGYLGRVGLERLQVPQIVVIDRNGVIRAQSRPVGEKNLEDETHLRSLIVTLLGKNTPVASRKKSMPTQKKESHP